MKTVLYTLALTLFTVSISLSQSKISPNRTRDINKDTSDDTYGFFNSANKSKSVPEFGNIRVTPEITFNEDPYNHNMHITSDGKNYYTINGGDAFLVK